MHCSRSCSRRMTVDDHDESEPRGACANRDALLYVLPTLGFLIFALVHTPRVRCFLLIPKHFGVRNLDRAEGRFEPVCATAKACDVAARLRWLRRWAKADTGHAVTMQSSSFALGLALADEDSLRAPGRSLVASSRRSEARSGSWPRGETESWRGACTRGRWMLSANS